MQISKLEMFQDLKNAKLTDLKKGEKTMCIKCNDTGWINWTEEHNGIEYEYARYCECSEIMQKRKANEERIIKSGLQDAINKYTFENFSIEEEWQRKIIAKVRKFAADPKGFLFVGGQPGAGKTHICTAICSELMKAGKDVLYMKWIDEIRKYKGSWNDEAMELWKTVDVLYIDDFLKLSNTESDVKLALEIINARYLQADTITIISTEYYTSEIKKIDQALGSRIMEKSKGKRIEITRDERRNKRLEQYEMNFN